MSNPLHLPAYHIFCDEYGDQALKRTASEWFIVSAVVVSAQRERDLPTWVARINQRRRNPQGSPLHFADLDERTKLWATRFVGKLRLRCFTLLSHKANMIGYRNVRAERAGDLREYGDDGTSFVAKPRRTLRYPNFVLKVLLERVTAWCHDRSLHEYGGPRPAAITIGQRGGFYLDPFKAYLEIDRRNAASRTGVLPGYLAWPVVDPDLITTAPAANIAGLQLADIVAGAFSRAVDEKQFGVCDRRFVHNLYPRVARKGKERRMDSWGVTGLPWKLWRAKLTPEQEALFRLFDYEDEKLVRPSPIFVSST
jgi:hypothetical protein